jgi:hypothetical protein
MPPAPGAGSENSSAVAGQRGRRANYLAIPPLLRADRMLVPHRLRRPAAEHETRRLSSRGADRRCGDLVVAESRGSGWLRCARHDKRRQLARSHGPVSLETMAFEPRSGDGSLAARLGTPGEAHAGALERVGQGADGALSRRAYRPSRAVRVRRLLWVRIGSRTGGRTIDKHRYAPRAGRY